MTKQLTAAEMRKADEKAAKANANAPLPVGPREYAELYGVTILEASRMCGMEAPRNMYNWAESKPGMFRACIWAAAKLKKA